MVAMRSWGARGLQLLLVLVELISGSSGSETCGLLRSSPSGAASAVRAYLITLRPNRKLLHRKSIPGSDGDESFDRSAAQARVLVAKSARVSSGNDSAIS